MPPVRLICNDCGNRVWLDEAAARVCRDCGGPLRAMGRLEGLVDRWFAPPDQNSSELCHRHTQMIELMWTAGDRAHELYLVVQPRGVSYSGFIRRVTEVVCRGIEEGWVEVRLPNAPVRDDSAYQLTFLDPERFADEVGKLFPDKQ
ncbi:MAG: hypothetical protein HY690_06815 [Chloroflexi bacterium]|nr:hypothetical protein [Chloroflexota bacterium]